MSLAVLLRADTLRSAVPAEFTPNTKAATRSTLALFFPSPLETEPSIEAHSASKLVGGRGNDENGKVEVNATMTILIVFV